MTTFVYHSDDHEVHVFPLDNLDLFEVPEGLEDDFYAFIDEEQPTLAETENWLVDHA